MGRAQGPEEEPSNPRDQTAQEREALRQVADLVAMILDTAIGIPGTRLRIGLDPLLGLIPGIGDTIVNLIGSGILLVATRLGIQRIVLTRMALNMFVNGTVGAIPVLGDAFSVWFRSNERNAKLLRRHSQGETIQTTTGDWFFVIGLGVATLAAIVAVMLAVLWVVAGLWRLASGTLSAS